VVVSRSFFVALRSDSAESVAALALLRPFLVHVLTAGECRGVRPFAHTTLTQTALDEGCAPAVRSSLTALLLRLLPLHPLQTVPAAAQSLHRQHSLEQSGPWRQTRELKRAPSTASGGSDLSLSMGLGLASDEEPRFATLPSGGAGAASLGSGDACFALQAYGETLELLSEDFERLNTAKSLPDAKVGACALH
jgi:hypothetical protein